MKLKKIIYIAPGLPVGGAEKFLVSLSNSLLKQTSRQIIVSLSDNNPLEKEFDPSIDIVKLPRQYRKRKSSMVKRGEVESLYFMESFIDVKKINAQIQDPMIPYSIRSINKPLCGGKLL